MKLGMYTLYNNRNPIITRFSWFPDFTPIFNFTGISGQKIGKIGWIMKKPEDMS